MTTSEDDNDPPQAPRSRALLGLLLLVCLLAAVLFVVRELRESAQMQDCLASGRTNCAPIQTDRN